MSEHDFLALRAEVMVVIYVPMLRGYSNEFVWYGFTLVMWGSPDPMVRYARGNTLALAHGWAAGPCELTSERSDEPWN